MITISLCMIVKNEEDTLGRCLDSVQGIVDEINIVDTGSDDRTKEIASNYTNRIFDFEWVNDFAKARNFAFQTATKDFILWFDADDVFLEEDRRKLQLLKNELEPSIDSVTMEYHLAADEYGNVTMKSVRNRLVNRSKQFEWIGAVHEYLEVSGDIFTSDIAVTHKSIRHDADRNLQIYEQQLSEGREFTPRDLFYYANELRDHQLYERAAEYYEKFLSTRQGWVEDNISACIRLADCYFALGDAEAQLESTLRSLQYDHPRPELCCRLGFYFISRHNYNAAIFWYQLATTIELPKGSMGFQNPSFSTWLPHLQLCVCYDRIGQYELAYKHNEEARTYRPTDTRILHNKIYLEPLLHKEA
ncbi:glycosyltransferase family 2 protein [Paenibacillus sp. YPG26]|uniref:tetratricopeptide repeat-containing glycosyltransferase family 2 protein n=1 Tax=Paenibacillus sp. YPG26 TaxID=2878915 RepID=UPI00203F38DB|nr:glycosyltransferase family 2 protein [Paenibacillus sp. YPG26]USB34389.1 glycosyltransferase family 2 protein [Paenibacillus sp. YPG26]